MGGGKGKRQGAVQGVHARGDARGEDRRLETEDRRPETEDGIPQTADRRLETADRRPQTEDHAGRVGIGIMEAVR
jgi:hypothetical protein